MKLITGLAMISAISVMFLTGCNTVEGFGKDVESLGRNVEDAAD